MIPEFEAELVHSSHSSDEIILGVLCAIFPLFQDSPNCKYKEQIPISLVSKAIYILTECVKKLIYLSPECSQLLSILKAKQGKEK